MTTIYKEGDAVKLIPIDDYVDDNVQQSHWRKHGRGPYSVEEVEDVATRWGDSAMASVKHPQLVTICGETFSGYWLEPASRS